MIAEQRRKKIDKLSKQIAELQVQLKELQYERILDEQQECLEFVGRAFKDDDKAVLITSVPLITLTMNGKHFNKYQYPCVKVSLKDNCPPLFEDTFFLTKEILNQYTEIPLKDFKEILNVRIEKLMMLAATAKMRQQGRSSCISSS